jgi:thiol-disulfide isomerase/thioredoxin
MSFFTDVVNPSVQRNRFFYSSPFQDIAQTYLPVTMQELFQYTKYYYRTNPIIAPIIDKLAEYPITNFVIDMTGEQHRNPIRNFVEEDLGLREFLIGMGQDWGVYGNSFVSVIYPFKRYLVCQECKSSKDIESTKRWKYSGTRWTGWCSKCKQEVTMKIRDAWIPDPKKIKLHRWPVEQIDIQYNKFTGEYRYFYRISKRERKQIESGIKFYVEKTPKVFLDAVMENKDIELDKKNLFHFKRSSIADDMMEWGTPIMYPALKEAFHWQILRKGNEAIAMQYIMPLTVLFPQPNGEANPFTQLPLGEWKQFVERQLARWKKDPNHIPLMPIPLGSQQIFGNARALMVTPEMKQTEESIIAACQVPREFIYGGLSYSGTSVSLRMLENHFLVYREQVSRFLKWVSGMLCTFMKWPNFEIRLSDFKMADDIQQKQLVLELANQKMVSMSHVLEDMGADLETEFNKIKREIQMSGEIGTMQQKEAAEAQGEALKIQMKYEAEAQIEAQRHMQNLQEKMMMEDQRDQLTEELGRGDLVPGASGVVPFDPIMVGSQMLDMLKMSPAEQRMSLIQQLQGDSPEMLGVMNEVAKARRGFPSQMQPMPEQRAPQRGADKASI